VKALKNLKRKISSVIRIYKRMPNFTHELVFDLNLMLISTMNLKNVGWKGALIKTVGIHELWSFLGRTL